MDQPITIRKRRAKLEKMENYARIVSKWEEAMEQIGDVGNKRVTAIEFTKDGRIRAEFETNGKRAMEHAGEMDEGA